MKMKRPIQKLLALVLCLAMLSTLIVFNVSAETDPISISTPEELEQILTNPSRNFVLANDIVFEDDGVNANWNPVGSAPFSGTLDGNGHGIYNLRVKGTASNRYVGGLLYATGGATIQNLSIYGSIVTEGASNAEVGGFVGQASSTSFSNCDSYMDITSAGYMVGGIAGKLYNGYSVINCTNNGTILANSTGSQIVGGIIGYCVNSNPNTFTNCTNNGAITAKNGTEVRVGGILGRYDATGLLTIEECINNGTIDVSVTKISMCGGIVGYIVRGSDHQITDCLNYGTLTDSNVSENNHNSLTGGIVGRVNVACTISGCVNFATLNTYAYGAGGIVGGRATTGVANVSYCSNLGLITAKKRTDNYSQFVGGIVGFTQNGYETVSYCYSIKDITSDHTGAKVGGLLGGYSDSRYYGKKASFTNCVSDFEEMTGVADCAELTDCVGTTDLNKALATLNGGDNQNAFRKSWKNEGTIEPIYYLTAAKISVVGAQIRKNDNNYDVRFVSAVSSLDFDAVGYQITVTGTGVNKTTTTPNFGSTVVYSAIYETVDGEDQIVYAPYGCAFYTETITGISYDNYDELTFTVTPFVVVGGVTQLQNENAVTFVFNDGVAK